MGRSDKENTLTRRKVDCGMFQRGAGELEMPYQEAS